MKKESEMKKIVNPLQESFYQDLKKVREILEPWLTIFYSMSFTSYRGKIDGIDVQGNSENIPIRLLFGTKKNETESHGDIFTFEFNDEETQIKGKINVVDSNPLEIVQGE